MSEGNIQKQPDEIAGTIPKATEDTETVRHPLQKYTKEDAAATRRHCNCAKSKCLKGYCECFQNGQFCIGCDCIDCFNTPECIEIVNEASIVVCSKRIHSFGTPNLNAPRRGCKCKKNSCNQAYCECLQQNKACGPSCKCMNCQNTPKKSAPVPEMRKILPSLDLQSPLEKEYAIPKSISAYEDKCQYFSSMKFSDQKFLPDSRIFNPTPPVFSVKVSFTHF